MPTPGVGIVCPHLVWSGTLWVVSCTKQQFVVLVQVKNTPFWEVATILPGNSITSNFACMCVRSWVRVQPPAVPPWVDWQRQCGCTMADLCSVSDCINTEWGWLSHAGPWYWSVRRDLTAAPIVLRLPLLCCQSIALCVDFLPIDKSLCPIAFVELSVKPEVLPRVISIQLYIEESECSQC